jgi:hypothetical protein
MPLEKPTRSSSLPGTVQEFIAAFMRALKAGRLYSSGHALFRQNAKRLYDQLQEARENGDFFFIGFAKDSLLLEDAFFEVSDVHGRDFLNLFHSMGISHLIIQKEVTINEIESFVETFAGAKPGQGQEIIAALHRENIRHVNLGLLDYSVFSGVESAVNNFIQGKKEAAIWRQLIFRPAMAGAYNLGAHRMKELILLAEDVDSLKQTLAELDRNLKNHVKGISPAQRGRVIGNFLQNISKSLASIDRQKRYAFAEKVALILQSIRPEMRISILGSPPLESMEGEDRGVIQELIDRMPEQELVYLLVQALSESGGRTIIFNNLFQRTLGRFKDTGDLLSLVRSEMNRATQERRPGNLNFWQHLEQILIYQQESEDFNVQYRKAVEDLATSIKVQKGMVEEEEIARLVRMLDPDTLKLFRARLIIDLVEEPDRHEATTLLLLQSMGETVKHFLTQGRPRLAGNLLRQVFLSVGQNPKKAFFSDEVDSWLRTEDVHHLLKALLEKCSTYEPREMSAISSICQLFPEKAGGFLIDLYVGLGDRQGSLEDWLTTTLASLAPHTTRVLGSRMTGAQDAALPRLIDLADLFADQQTAPALETLLDHKDYDIRSQVVRTLGRLKSAKSIEPLARVVLEKTWFTGKKTKALKMEALQALAEIQTKEARLVLERIASTASGEIKKLSQELLEKS